MKKLVRVTVPYIYMSLVEDLTDEDAGKLLKGLLRYGWSGEEPEIEAGTRCAMLFDAITGTSKESRAKPT